MRSRRKTKANLTWPAGPTLSWTAHGEKIRVYSLPDLKLESTFNVDLFAGVNSMAMGAATNGPLLISNPPFRRRATHRSEDRQAD